MPARIFLAAMAAILAGAFIYSRKLQREPALTDPAIAELRTNNPNLIVEPENSRRLVYLVKEPSTGRGVRLPMDEAAGARIRFVDCDLSRIPASVLYPNRTATTCLEVRNEDHLIEAYAFETNDSLAAMVHFFELNVEPGSRITASRSGANSRRYRKPFTHEFVVSYALENGWGFIGYGESAKLRDSHQEDPTR